MKPTEQEIFEYLDNLRGGGAVNMFGAVPCILDMFDLTKKEAREYLMKWMKNFKE